MRICHTYRYKEVVIGATLDSAIYAYENKVPIFFLNARPPHRFETTTLGQSKLKLYRKLMFLLSLNGYVPLTAKTTLLQIKENELSISTDNAALIKVQFEQMKIFDEAGLSGIGVAKRQKKEYLVLDWFNVRSGSRHEHEKLESDSEFVKLIQFYPSERIDGAHDKKDLVAFSYLDEQNIESYEYSETYVRLKVLSMMRAAGIKGAKNGLHPMSGNQKHRSLKIESAQREIIDMTRPIYEDTDILTFVRGQSTDSEIESKLCFLV